MGRLKVKEINLGEKLKSLRLKTGMTQAQCCEAIADYTVIKETMPISTLSSYESNYKRPPYEVLMAFSQMYKVSIDDILDNQITWKKNEKQSMFLDDFITKIDKTTLAKYDQKPVYIIKKNDEKVELSVWGIYDKANDRFVTSSSIVKNSNSLEYWAVLPDSFPLPKRVKASKE